LKTDQDVQKVSRFFSTIKEHITKLETTSYKTTMMLFYDLMKKLENGIFPSHSEVRDLNLEATKAWNFYSDKDLEEKLKMSKIRLFCKSYEVLFNEKTNTFKRVDSLEPNEQNYLSEFMNSEIAQLEEISSYKVGNMMKKGISFNMKKTQNFIDEIDQIKRLSYSTIKKEDFAFEHNGKISKYWTLNKNMVTEGEDDSLEGIDCTFRNTDSNIETMKFRVYSDLFSNWRVEIVSSKPFSDSLSISLCAVEGECSALSTKSVYFPQVDKDTTAENVKIWILDMRHLKYPEKEVTLIFSFTGSMDKPLSKVFDNLNRSVLKTIVEEDLDLIRQINEFTFKDPTGSSVSMSLIVCNFLKDAMKVDGPFLTSGTLDSTMPWPASIQPSTVALLFTRKKTIEARGSVGLTVITVTYCLHSFNFAIYWQAPFDFNLYENSFAVFPLPNQDISSKEATKTYKSFIDYSNVDKMDEKYIGVRGFAKDGPKALEYCGMLISAKMGVRHDDFMQISILPLDTIDK
jgi:hypothetical protein